MKTLILLTIAILLISCEKDEYTVKQLTDIDGNTYKTVTIGNQTWMAENLKTTRYPDGSEIIEIIECEDWQSLDNNDEAFSRYENNDNFGGYYTYAAATKSCPDGWHLPTRNEWDELEIYLYNNGFNGAEGSSLKTITGWDNDGNGTNDFSFSALPSGRRYRSMISNECIGQFYNMGKTCYWWSSTEYSSSFVYYRRLSNTSDEMYENNDVKKTGFTVRCLKDNN